MMKTIVEGQRYNERVRQAISDQYVEYSKMYANTHKECLEVESKLNCQNSKKNLSYEEYVDLEKYLNNLREEMRVLKIQIDIWDAAREVCLNISDEICSMSNKK